MLENQDIVYEFNQTEYDNNIVSGYYVPVGDLKSLSTGELEKQIIRAIYDCHYDFDLKAYNEPRRLKEVFSNISEAQKKQLNFDLIDTEASEVKNDAAIALVIAHEGNKLSDDKIISLFEAANLSNYPDTINAIKEKRLASIPLELARKYLDEAGELNLRTRTEKNTNAILDFYNARLALDKQPTLPNNEISSGVQLPTKAQSSPFYHK